LKIFKFWTVENGVFEFRGERFSIKCYGGSNSTLADASAKALEKIERVKLRISGSPDKRQDSYESEIREEPLQFLDDANVVTRNRYGAEVLNCRSLMFVDIDKAPSPSIWSLLGLSPKRSPLERILDSAAALSEKELCKGLGLRVYATCKGVRVIVQGRPFDASSKESEKMLKAFRCDWLYAALCRKQGCFRARLTPKPYRLKIPSVKVSVIRSPEEDASLKEWLRAYEEASKGFAVCKLVASFGESFKSDRIVEFHDERTKALSSLKLA